MKRTKITNKSRKKMNNSGTQPCSVCGDTEILIEHHIAGRDIEGAGDPSNLTCMCDNCHRKVHKGLIVLEGWATTTTGKQLFWHEAGEESFIGGEVIPYTY